MSPLQIISLVATRRLDLEPFVMAAAPAAATSDPTVEHHATPQRQARAAVSPRAYAMATAILAAHEASTDPTAATKLAALLPRLTNAGLVTPEAAAAIAGALGALPVAPPANGQAGEQLARDLAAHLSNSGAFLERRLASLVQGGRAQAELATDLRARLALLAATLAEAPDVWADAREVVRDLQHALLVEQARFGAHFADEGVLDFRVRLAPAGEAEVPVHLRIEPDAEHAGEAEDGGTPWRRASLALTLDGLGAIRVNLLAAPDGHIRTEFLVAEADAADRIETDLGELTTALEAAGFTLVLSRVVVDPVRAEPTDQLPDLPAHLIVDVQA